MKKIAVIILSSLLCYGLFAQTLNIDLGYIPATAESQCTGKVWVQVAGGVAPYTFEWNNGETATYQENLCLGTYSVTVTDASDATAETSVEFSTSSQIIIPLNGNTSAISSLYQQCDGTVNVYAYGGITPYEYQIFDATTGLLISESNSLTDICSGEYYAVCIDANNGIYFNPFTVGVEYIRLTPTQYPGSYPINQPATFEVAGEPPFTVNITSNSSNPQSYTIETTTDQIAYTPLYSEFYNIQLTDNLGNEDQESFCAYDEVNLMNLSSTPASNGCDGMIISSNPVDVIMNYEVSPNVFNSIHVENGTLCPGEYLAIVQDAFCPSVMNETPIIITGPQYDYPQVNVFSSNTIYNICTGMAWLEVEGGTSPYQYNWINYSSNTTDFIDNLCSGNLFVKVTNANNVWSIGHTFIESDLPETEPGDTLSASQDECIDNITSSYIYAYTVNDSNVIVTWAIEHDGTTTYLDVTYNYVITLPGVYNVELILNCQGGKSTVHLITELNISLTGINNDKNNEINIYPNPVNDMLNISLTETVESLEITSISGAIISKFKANGTQMTFNVSDLSTGVYMIRFINSDGSTIIKKFIK
ncbi:MAG: T9SS type A sorting domain-containing protein [Bacteroidales bacterium]|jgi:hypothetical protein|nr:T9SS type A sorting domain-containing protein [Bacteroidales bacterium]